MTVQKLIKILGKMNPQHTVVVLQPSSDGSDLIPEAIERVTLMPDSWRTKQLLDEVCVVLDVG